MSFINNELWYMYHSIYYRWLFLTVIDVFSGRISAVTCYYLLCYCSSNYINIIFKIFFVFANE